MRFSGSHRLKTSWRKRPLQRHAPFLTGASSLHPTRSPRSVCSMYWQPMVLTLAGSSHARATWAPSFHSLEETPPSKRPQAVHSARSFLPLPPPSRVPAVLAAARTRSTWHRSSSSRMVSTSKGRWQQGPGRPGLWATHVTRGGRRTSREWGLPAVPPQHRPAVPAPLCRPRPSRPGPRQEGPPRATGRQSRRGGSSRARQRRRDR